MPRKRPTLRESDPLRRLAWSIDDAAEALGVSRSQLFRMANSGELRTIRVGRRVLIPADVLEELLHPPVERAVAR